jgi:hypothetical protein
MLGSKKKKEGVLKEGRELRRRVVEVSESIPKRGKLWAFGYGEVSKLLGLSEWAVRQRVHRGLLDPGDLKSLCMVWLENQEGLKEEGSL